MQNIIAHSWIWNVQHLEFSFVQAKEEKAERRARKKAGKQKKYKTVMRTVKRKATKTITRTVTETVTNEETGEEDDDDEEEEEEEEEEVIKHATKNDAYSLCVKYKLSSIAKCFGLTPEQFGENLQGNYMKNETVQVSSLGQFFVKVLSFNEI